MLSTQRDLYWMQQALEIAANAAKNGEMPVGALLVKANKLLAVSGNMTLHQDNPTAHAEMLVLSQAAQKLKTPYLHNTTLYVTLEPCLMCLGAIMHLQVQRVVFGAYDAKKGAAGGALDILQLPSVEWRPDMVGGIEEEKSCQLLRSFFQRKRVKIPPC